MCLQHLKNDFLESYNKILNSTGGLKISVLRGVTPYVLVDSYQVEFIKWILYYFVKVK